MLRSSEILLNGHSMYPAIKDQDILEVDYFDQPKKVNDFNPGDVVFIRADDEWIVHRVVENEGRLKTKGDWSQFYDSEASIWGKIQAVNGKKGFQTKDSRLGFLSTQLCQKNRLKRRWVRLKILFYVFFKRIFSKRRMILSTHALSFEEIERHHLQGFSYSESKNQTYHNTWKSQVIKNQLVADELNRIGPEFGSEGIEVTILKGFALMGDIYQDMGTRFASDVDLLVSKEDLEACLVILKSRGYELREEDTWLGNDFKKTLSRKTELLEITIELHTKLYWHFCKYNYDTVWSRYFESYKTLNLEEQLIHLCGHLGFQHTFLKMFWLFDIQRFVKKYDEDINWVKFWQKAKQYELYDNCVLCMSLVGNESRLENKKSLKQKVLVALCSQKFLINPREHSFRYFAIKFLLKDRLINNFRYLSGWVKYQNKPKL